MPAGGILTRATRVRALLALAILALSTFLALTQPVRLGLDLRGGTQLVLETRDSPTATADRDATDRTLEVLRRRVDALGVSEPNLTRAGDHRIVVELPGVHDPDEAAEILGRTAQLTVHPVLGTAAKGTKPADGDRNTVLPDESGTPLRLGPAALTGAEVQRAEAEFDAERGGGWSVGLGLRGTGERAWAQLTGQAACAAAHDPARRAAIVLDNKIISSPAVEPSVACGTGITGGHTQITGGFDQRAAQELALLINGGALPVPVDLVEQRAVGPTLGAQAITSSATAAAIGIALTALFLTVIYRLLGALATLALACYALISYAALLALGATLTLPGLAGFVLAIGMAVDANVLVFERAREEYAAGRGTRPRTLRSALTAGFRNALSAIADTNITTLLAAGLLFAFASGPVRGFGVTLCIGVAASMVSALLITRVLAEYAIARGPVQRRPRLTGLAGLGRIRTWLTRRSPNLMRHRRRWLALSGAAVLLATSGIAVRGLDYGVEFTGGRMIEYTTSRPVDAERARTALGTAGLDRAQVTTSGDRSLTVRTEHLSADQLTTTDRVVNELGNGAEKIRDELIGPSLGDELRNGALIALGLALAAQLVYLTVRFQGAFALSAVIAMAHDVLVLVGVFAWLDKPIDGVFLAALLTVIGYSVNDTVVVFDRIRELRTTARGTPFPDLANHAVLQTVPRTINTGMGAAFILAALAVLGGDTLTDFALALLIGITVGTYSSIFTATPLAIALTQRSNGNGNNPAPRRSRRPAPRRRDPRDNGARV
ncbi:protein translocase subunit SecD [Streptomyces sp. NPDC090442]|uniref:protein translocase subunit SecD n=1 Tax=Streptomyces sp. NPDC090442 TaxID=3365962 RepID=UPI0037F6E4B6